MANSILQLTSMELLQSVENELLENPALETLDDQTCSGDCPDPASCPFCSQRKAAAVEADPRTESLDSGDYETEYDSYSASPLYDIDEDYDPVGNLEAEITLQEHLRGLLRTAVSAEDYWIGEYIINTLDDKGWLSDSPANIARELGICEDDVRRVLDIIQTFDPPGIGARDLKECMLLQVKYLKEEELSPVSARLNDLAEIFIRDYFDYISHVSTARFIKIARAVGISVEEAKQTMDYIKNRLHPYPASQFRPPWAYRPTNTKASIRPDVIIRRTEFGYDVEVLGADPYGLGLNPTYRDAYDQIKTGNGHHTDDDKKHITEYVERAELFIRNINQRRKTLRLITRCIVDCQTGFLETGSRQFLRPLTRTAVAKMLAIHESTVSRATANKYVQLPNQEVVSFDFFFNGSLSVKDAIEEMIQDEDPANPLSDQQITELLQEKGISVARRTIVKYRESQKILSSARRRR
jgi:RNA polymerase sigma-54 factor